MDYVVQPGDSLWRIAAKQLGAGARWREIANDNQIGDHQRLAVGERLWLRDAVVKGSAGPAAPVEREPTHGVEGATSVIPGRAFVFVLADEINPASPKVVRKVMVSPSMAAEYAKKLGRPIDLQVNPELHGLFPESPSSPLTIARHASGMKPSPFVSASTHPLGAPRMIGSRFWIDVARAKQSGAQFFSTEAIVADLDRIMRKTANPSGARRIEQYKAWVRGDGEVLIRGAVPAAAIKGAGAMAITRGLQGVQIVGFAMTAVDIAHATQRSIEQGSPKPIAAEGIRQTGAWATAWGGMKLGAGIGAALGIETGPGAVVSTGLGGFVGGVAGYFGFDWVADHVSPN